METLQWHSRRGIGLFKFWTRKTILLYPLCYAILNCLIFKKKLVIFAQPLLCPRKSIPNRIFSDYLLFDDAKRDGDRHIFAGSLYAVVLVGARHSDAKDLVLPIHPMKMRIPLTTDPTTPIYRPSTTEEAARFNDSTIRIIRLESLSVLPLIYIHRLHFIV